MKQTRFNSIDQGERILARLDNDALGSPVLQIWEKLDSFEDMLPIVWEMKQRELADEKKRSAEHTAELELIDSWLKSGITTFDESGNSVTVGETRCDIVMTKDGEPEVGGIRLYVDKHRRKVIAYINWDSMHSIEQYNSAMRGIRDVCWRVEERNR